MENKFAISYNRWQHTVRLESWLKSCCKYGKTEKEFYAMMEQITEDEINSISSIPKTNQYRASGRNGSYNFVLEKIKKSHYIVMLYKDHQEYYEYNSVLEQLHATIEIYAWRKNGFKEICFHHNVYNNNLVRANFISLNLEITFHLKKDRPVCKMFKDYVWFFEQITQYGSSNFNLYGRDEKEKSMIENIFSVCRMLNKSFKPDSNVKSFCIYAKGRRHEYIDVKDGKIARMRIFINGNFVIFEENGNVIWEENLFHWEEFTYRDGVVRDGKDRVVEDEELAKRIISCIKEGRLIFERLLKQWEQLQSK